MPISSGVAASGGLLQIFSMSIYIGRYVPSFAAFLNVIEAYLVKKKRHTTVYEVPTDTDDKSMCKSIKIY